MFFYFENKNHEIPLLWALTFIRVFCSTAWVFLILLFWDKRSIDNGRVLGPVCEDDLLILTNPETESPIPG